MTNRWLWLSLALAGCYAGGGVKDFDWSLCDKETACFIGGGSCGAALTLTKTKPAKPCDVALSLRLFDASKRTAVHARLLLRRGFTAAAAAAAAPLAATLTASSAASFGCRAAAAGVVTADSAMLDEELLASSASSSHLYCELLLRSADPIFPEPSPASPAAEVTYSIGSSAQKTITMDYDPFYKAIFAAVTCDPDLIRFEPALRMHNQTTRAISSMRHAATCGGDGSLWEMEVETRRDSGVTEPIKALLCERDAGNKWAWKVTSRVKPMLAAFRAHCAAYTCALCPAPTPCSSPDCTPPSFTAAGESQQCTRLTCPAEKPLFSSPSSSAGASTTVTSATVACTVLAPGEYRWTIDNVPVVDTVECVEAGVKQEEYDALKKRHTILIAASAGSAGVIAIGLLIYCCCVRRLGRRSRPSSKRAQSSATTKKQTSPSARLRSSAELRTGRSIESEPESGGTTKSSKPAAVGRKSRQGQAPVAAAAVAAGSKEDAAASLKEAPTQQLASTEEVDGKEKPSVPRPAKKSRLSSRNRTRTTECSIQSKTGAHWEAMTDVTEQEVTGQSGEGTSEKVTRSNVPLGPLRYATEDNSPYQVLTDYGPMEPAVATPAAAIGESKKSAQPASKGDEHKKNPYTAWNGVAQQNSMPVRTAVTSPETPRLVTGEDRSSRRDKDDRTQADSGLDQKKGTR